VITCLYKKTFLSDLASIDLKHRERMENLVFEKIPGLENINALFQSLDVKSMRGHPGHFRVRFGRYRVGFVWGPEGRLTFSRVKHRKDIYRVFPN
jgi:mRNA interferase RelE/StbE